MISKKDCLSFARRIYVDKESVKLIAKSTDYSERWVLVKARTAIPALISEQGWTVKDVMARFRGSYVPAEMRREVIWLHKTHGLVKAAKMTGVPEGTLSRWVNTRAGGGKGKGVLSMGKRSWARLEGSESDEDSGSNSKAKPNDGKPKPRVHKSMAMKEQAVHRLTNEGVSIAEVAKEFGVPDNTIYSWRRQLLGKATDSKFGSKARALAKQFVTAARISDQMGDDAPQQNVPASASRTIQGPGTFVDAPDLASLHAELTNLGHLAETIAQDREIVMLKIENEQLRRQLNDR